MPIAKQQSSMPTSARFRRGDDNPHNPIASPRIATTAAGGQKMAKIAEKTPKTSDVTVPPIAIIPARRASIISAVVIRRLGL